MPTKILIPLYLPLRIRKINTRLKVVGAKTMLSNPHTAVLIVLYACYGIALNMTRLSIKMWILFLIPETLVFVELVRFESKWTPLCPDYKNVALRETIHNSTWRPDLHLIGHTTYE